MKFYLSFLLPLLLIFSSCQKTEYIDAVQNRTIVVDIASTSWRSSNGGKNYFTTINMPEVTNEFNERGGVLIYLSFGNRSYEQLPEVYNGVAYSFTSRPGQIEVELQSSDGTTVITPPSQTITAKIILVESQF